jgi:hypothetical protein
MKPSVTMLGLVLTFMALVWTALASEEQRAALLTDDDPTPGALSTTARQRAPPALQPTIRPVGKPPTTPTKSPTRPDTTRPTEVRKVTEK